MTLAVPSGYDPTSLTPGVAGAIRFAVGGATQPAPRKLCLVGNKIATNIVATVNAVNYTTTAGTMSLATLYFCGSPEEAGTLAGYGSELQLMAKRVFQQYSRPSLYLLAVAENGAAVKATAVVLLAGSPTGTGVLRLVLGGRSIPEVVITTTSTPTSIAQDTAIAIDKITDFPVTATVSAGTLTLTAKQGGPRGNELAYEVEITAPGVTVALGGAGAGTIKSGFLGDGTGVDGAGADDITAALAAVASERLFFAVAQNDATNIGVLRTHVNAYAAITERRRQQAIYGATKETVAAAITAAQAVNALRIQRVYKRATGPNTSIIDPNVESGGELAAQIAALRLYGDGAVGGGIGRVRGELAYPAANLDYGLLASILDHKYSDTRLTLTEVEALLRGGITPLVGAPANPGGARMVKSCTTRSLDASANPDYKVHDTSKVTVSDHVCDGLEKLIADEFPNKNIADEPETRGTPPTHPDIVFPSTIATTALNQMRLWEREGLITDVDANPPLFERHTTNPNLVIGSIPSDVIDHLHSVAFEVSQTG